MKLHEKLSLDNALRQPLGTSHCPKIFEHVCEKKLLFAVDTRFFALDINLDITFFIREEPRYAKNTLSNGVGPHRAVDLCHIQDVLLVAVSFCVVSKCAGISGAAFLHKCTNS